MAGRTTKATALLLLCLLLFPAAVLAAGSAPVRSSAIQVTRGHLEGPLAGAVWAVDPDEDAAATGLADAPQVVEAPGFYLAAARGEVTIHHSERPLSTPAGSPLPSETAPPTRWSLANVTARGAVADADDLRLVALPGDGTLLQVQGLDLALRPAPAGSTTFQPRTETETFGFATGTALEILRPEGSEVRILGHVRLVVTGIDVVLRADGGEQVLHTREDLFDYAEVPGPAYARRTVVHEAFLDLVDAVLIIPAAKAYIEGGTLESDGAWALADARGVLPLAGSDLDLRGDDVSLHGDLAAVVARQGSTVTADLSGAIDSLQVGGQAIALDGTSPSVSAPSDWLAVALLPLALLLAAAHVAIGRNRFGRLDRAMDRRDYAQALAIARRFSLHPRLQEDAALAQAVCLLALEQPARAVQQLDGRPRWAPHRRATRDFLAARAEAALGNGEAALRRLAASLAANPALVPEARIDPVLSPLLRSLWPAASAEAYA